MAPSMAQSIGESIHPHRARAVSLSSHSSLGFVSLLVHPAALLIALSDNVVEVARSTADNLSRLFFGE